MDKFIEGVLNKDVIIQCDVTKGIPLPDKSVHCVVTSPPYWGLRDYGTARWEGGDPECDHIEPKGSTRGGPKSTITGGQDLTPHKGQYEDTCKKCGAKRIDAQLGLEKTPEEYIEHMVAVFCHVWRVLRDDGTCWLNMGDSYAGGGRGGGFPESTDGRDNLSPGVVPLGLKQKDLCMMPARLAIALQADGWYLRSDIIWAKPNPMPESTKDRCTKSHEHLFMLTKKPKYFYDADAVRESDHPDGRSQTIRKETNRYEGEMLNAFQDGEHERWTGSRNKRDVWTIPTQSFPEAHFATFPEKLVEPCIKAGTSEKGCCPECGSPWVRVVEKGELVPDAPHYKPRGNMDKPKGVCTPFTPAGKTEGHPNFHYEKTTIGWKPICKCLQSKMNKLKNHIVKGDKLSVEQHIQNLDYMQEMTVLKENLSPIPCTVFDPFGGAMTTCLVAYKLNRHYVATELSAEYIKMAEKRIGQEKDKYSLIEA